jgi:glycosyltransferase involved in cell wall biosynthesis
MKIVAYAYYSSPWEMRTGDDVRIHTMLTQLGKDCEVIAINLSAFASSYDVYRRNDVIYIIVPRKLYRIISRLVRWRNHYDLNPLIKLTHYLDEFIAALKFINMFKKAKIVFVFGSMSLFSFILRSLEVKNVTIVYDAFGNYAQTLYLRSRKSVAELLRYGLYLALHKLQIKSSNIVIYPSYLDLEIANRMFRLTKATVIPNPTPICYNNVEEYLELRKKRTDFDRAYFILLAGGRGKNNEEAVRTTIEVFNKVSSKKFKLFISGPWKDMKIYVENPSIELLGVVPKEILKELLAISDYGLSPIFSHSAGTFIKVLAYLSAGLEVIASPYSIIGIDAIYSKVYMVKNKEEFSKVIQEIIDTYGRARAKKPLVKLCNEQYTDLNKSLSRLLVLI